MNEKRYVVISTEPYPYVDAGGKFIRGVLVRVRFNDYDEIHEIMNPRANVLEIANKIEALLAIRDELNQLG